MTNITLAIPDVLHEKMRQHSEIRWSEVVRKVITEKVEMLEAFDKITKKSKLTQKDVDELSAKVNRAVAKNLGLK
ncbi:MAG TPA: hypothetical protein VJ044_11920 [Candidatus Hodarchaeales archaeon]|nr:hypothetical protein [Candidatus Hodarchaeales archaeon]HLC84736.1 hypothetical protein [Candidatus Nanoarchaeia archaeon]